MWPGKKLYPAPGISHGTFHKGGGIKESIGRKENSPEKSEADVDEEVCAAAGDEEDTNGWD